MNYIRYFLYGALFFICLVLWNTWQKEHPPTPVSQQTLTQSAPSIPTPQTIADTQQIQAAQTTSMQPDSQAVTEMAQVTPSSRLINVKTDVLDISIDKLGGNIVRASLLKYPEELKSSKPIQLFNDNPDTYYVSQNGFQNIKVKKQKFNLYTTTKNSYVLAKEQKQLTVTLNAKTPEGLELTKTYIFMPDMYKIKVINTVTNKTGKVWNGSYYMQLTRSSTQPPKKGTFSMRSFYGISVSSHADQYQKFYFAKLAAKPVNENIKGGWLAMVQHYFLGAWIPDPLVSYKYYSQVNNDGTSTVGAISPVLQVNPGESVTINANLYSGPKIKKRLDAISPYLAKTVDYGFLWIIAVMLFYAMKAFHKVVGNWGWSIVLVTIAIKLIFYKLSAASYKSMAAMRKMQPKLARLKEQYADNKQAYSRATMELYKKEKINPLGGCLPILIQLPVFFALYWVLLESVELRQAPFIFWIHDLSVKDPFYILPILMGISMFVQQKLSPSSPDPTQAKVMLFLPVIMTAFFLNFPAGLVLYWLVNNVVSVIQQWYIMRKFEHGGYKKEYKHNDKNRKKNWWSKVLQKR